MVTLAGLAYSFFVGFFTLVYGQDAWSLVIVNCTRVTSGRTRAIGGEREAGRVDFSSSFY